MLIRAISVAGILAITAIAGSARAAEDEDAFCFDTAVVARLDRLSYVPAQEDPDPDPDALTMYSQYLLHLAVDEVVVGPDLPDQISIRRMLHTTPRVPSTWLYFLRRDGEGGFEIVWREYVVRDFRGRFFVPVDAALDIAPDGPFAPTYESVVKPVRYDPQDLAWLQPDDLNKPEHEGRLALRGSRVVVRSGLFVGDLAPLLRPQQCKAKK